MPSVPRRQADVLDGGESKHVPAGRGEEPVGPHGYLVDEAAMKGPSSDQPAQGAGPFVTVVLKKFLLTTLQLSSSALGQMFLADGALHADELGAADAVGIALFFQPVGEDQTRRVVVGMGEDVLQESFGVRHGFPFSIKESVRCRSVRAAGFPAYR